MLDPGLKSVRNLWTQLIEQSRGLLSFLKIFVFSNYSSKLFGFNWSLYYHFGLIVNFVDDYLIIYFEANLSDPVLERPNSSFLKQLVKGLSEGDSDSFEELFSLFSKKIYNISRKMRLGHEDAEGVVQEVFLKIWKHRAKLDPELSINAYMIAIVRSLVIKKTRREARFFAFQSYQIPLLNYINSYGPEDDLIYSEFHNLSMEIIEQLPAGQRQIFKMRHLENLSIEEIAEKLNISKRTVENQVFRATKSFKERLAKLEIVSLGIWVFGFRSIVDFFFR